MDQYNVTGMSCAACSARVEKAVLAVEGATSCSVSLLTNSMGVEGTASRDAIIKAVVDAGYGATPKTKETTNKATDYEDELKDTETPKIFKRLMVSLLPLILLMYVSMGHMMLGWPIPPFLMDNPLGIGLYEMLLAIVVMVINQKFFVNGFKGVIHKAPNMDTLVALGSSASFIYSMCILFAMTTSVKSGQSADLMHYMHEFYFESAAMILVLITVGKLLEAKSKGRTTDALKSLMKLAPKTAILIKDGKEQEVAISEVRVGDIFAVKPGDSIPVDGRVLEGESAVDEASLTGESIPVDKVIGDKVSAATINQSGYLVCEATRVGEDTTLAQIIQMVSDAAATKAPIAKIADRVSGVFVPAVMIIAAVTFIVWMILGKDLGFSLARAISVLVISCPCALGLATPVAIMVGNGIGARNGIMFKTAISLEETGKAQIVALDKTGTITKGEPTVKALRSCDGYGDEELLTLAYSLEAKSEHPLANAIVKKAEEIGVNAKEITDFRIEAGNGLSGVINGNKVIGGNLKYVSKYVKINEAIKEEAKQAAMQGMTPLFFAKGSELMGYIAVADVIKEDSARAISELKNMGLHVVMLTGDNEQTAAAIGKEAGVDEIVAGVLPNEKEAVIAHLQQSGKVIMVGDGINDAPALTRADMGIAIGAGTDVAISAADVVLMKNSLSDVAAAIRLSRKTLKNIKENLFWAFIYNLLGIPLAAGVYIGLFGWTLNPMFGAAAMSLSSFCVVSNALRLNLFNIYKSSRDRRINNIFGSEPLCADYIKKNQEDNKMEIIVNGMMCGHCEAHMKSAMEKLEGVSNVVADHNQNLVTFEAANPIDEATLKATVEGAGYEFGGIK